MKITLSLVSLLASLSLFTQTFTSEYGKTFFIVNNNQTPVEAHNKKTTARINLDSLTITSSIYIKDFVFKNETNKDDFFNKTMMINSFGEADFKGKLKKINSIQYQVTGTLTIHGVSSMQIFPAQIHITENTCTATATFVIRYSDFEIIPLKKYSRSLSNDVLISIDFELSKLRNSEMILVKDESKKGLKHLDTLQSVDTIKNTTQLNITQP